MGPDGREGILEKEVGLAVKGAPGQLVVEGGHVGTDRNINLPELRHDTDGREAKTEQRLI